MNSVKALGDHSLRIEGTELTAYRRGGRKLARRYYTNEGLAKAAYKAVTTEGKLLAWAERSNKRKRESYGVDQHADTVQGLRVNPPKRGNRWRMSDGDILTTEQLKRAFFGKLPSPAQRRMLGIKKVTITKRNAPKAKPMRKTVRFYYDGGYMGFRIWNAASRSEAAGWLRNNATFPGKYSVKIGTKTYTAKGNLP